MRNFNKRRWAWLTLALAAMFFSACAFFGWLGAVGRISGWTGLAQYERDIPRTQHQAEIWLALVVTLPFLSALFLYFGRRKPGKFGPAFEYGVRLALSIAGSLGFAAFLLLFELLLTRTELHINLH